MKDIPDPFGRGASPYFLTYLYSVFTNKWFSSIWNTIATILVLSGACLFLWSFVLWLKSRGELMTNGPYRVARHPQYLGIITGVPGLSLGTARPIALISWGTMAYAYVSMSYLEEQSLTERFGGEYEKYKAKTWFMLPILKNSNKRPVRVSTPIVTFIATLVLVIYILTIIYVSYYHVVSLRGTTL